MPALNRLPATRIVSTPTALDSAKWPQGALVLRIASDEALVIPPAPAITLNDPYAIVESEGGLAGIWMPISGARMLLEHHCEWELPETRPAFCQGMVAGVPAKVWLEKDRVLFLVPAPFAHDFEERTRIRNQVSTI